MFSVLIFIHSKNCSRCGLWYLSSGFSCWEFNDVTPSVETVKSNAYPYARPLNMVTKGEATGQAKAYIDWLMSDAGQKWVGKKVVPAK